MRRLGCLLLLGLWLSVAQADVQCDGVDDRLTSGLALSTFFSATTYTLSLWLQSTGSTFDSDHCWDQAQAVTSSNEVVVLGRTGTATSNACAFAQDGTNTGLVVSALSAGWHHLAARLTGGTITLFVDGTSVGSVGSLAPVDDMTGLLQLCGAPDGFSPDRLADVQVFGTALSNAAIERIAQSRLRGYSQAAPTAYWPLDDCADGATGNGTFRDRSGNGRPLTGDLGGNGTGITCRGSAVLRRPAPIQ